MIISSWFLERDSESSGLQCPPQSPDLSPVEHWDDEERQVLIMDVQQLVMLSGQHGPTSPRNISNTLLNLCH